MTTRSKPKRHWKGPQGGKSVSQRKLQRLKVITKKCETMKMMQNDLKEKQKLEEIKNHECVKSLL